MKVNVGSDVNAVHRVVVTTASWAGMDPLLQLLREVMQWLVMPSTQTGLQVGCLSVRAALASTAPPRLRTSCRPARARGTQQAIKHPDTSGTGTLSHQVTVGLQHGVLLRSGQDDGAGELLLG